MTSDTIAYFSMEIALDPAMPTYCGGLGVLAGDTIRSAADLKVPMVAVTLLHRRGASGSMRAAGRPRKRLNGTWRNFAGNCRCACR
jgi:glucan phosphorylase